MDILRVIKKDHDEVRGLFAALENLGEDDAEESEGLFYQLRSTLLNHAKAEEVALYERIQEVDTTKCFALEGFQEHELVEYLVDKLETMEVEDWDRWQATLLVLKETVDHHVQEEEKEMFKLVKKEFNTEEREEMGIKMLDEKSTLAASPRKGPKKKDAYKEIRTEI